MPNKFHSKLNEALRLENRSGLVPWFAYLKLFINALLKLESSPRTIWRGVSGNIDSNFVENDVHTWWSISSCSSKSDAANDFGGEKGILLCIETIYGKSIKDYAANQSEDEVILLPGTRLRVESVSTNPTGGRLVHLQECAISPHGKHVMLCYHRKDQNLVSEIANNLQNQNIPVWFKKSEIYSFRNSLAEGVENAAAVCCFLTPDYQASLECQFELQYAHKRCKKMIPCILRHPNIWKPSEWLESVIAGLKCVEFDVFTGELDPQYITLGIKCCIEKESSLAKSLSSMAVDKPSYLFEIIKYEYQLNSRIEHFMNPSKSFPIEQSYINLVIVKNKDQKEKEKQLCDKTHDSAILGTYEEVYGAKDPIDVGIIFDECKIQRKQVLVFGRAGIGKSTFCRFVAYQWAKGLLWPQYELVAVIPVRHLTENRYPPGKTYSLIDVVKKEVFSYKLSKKEEDILEEKFDSHTLWILDGYDEIIQSIPSHLTDLLEKLRKTSHHILTSRPYLNTLSYDVQMEITGFTDKNIQQYVHQFFNQLKDEIDNPSEKTQSLLRYLKLKPSAFGVAHIPVNLELICSMWSNEDLSTTQNITLTKLYTMITEWLFRRYLQSRNINNNTPSDEDCEKGLAFLQCLAFHAMKTNTIIIRPVLLEKASKETNISLKKHSHILNFGVLKGFNKQGVGTQNEFEKDHYFIHLSFQEYFAAQYVVNLLKESSTDKAAEFIKYQKYNQRYALMFTFMVGLVSENETDSASNIFWNAILGEPIDLVGIRHMELTIRILEATVDRSLNTHQLKLLKWILQMIQQNIYQQNGIVLKHLSSSFRTAQSLASNKLILLMFLRILQSNDTKHLQQAILFITRARIINSSALYISIQTVLNQHKDLFPQTGPSFLAIMNQGSKTQDVIHKFSTDLRYELEHVPLSRSDILDDITQEDATSTVISKLETALSNKSEIIRGCACDAIILMREKATTPQLIKILEKLLVDDNEYVKMRACDILEFMRGNAATHYVIRKIASSLADKSETVRKRICRIIPYMGDKAVTSEVITKIAIVLGDQSEELRICACDALGKMGEKAATDAVITKLVIALGDQSEELRESACYVLGKMGEKAATDEVITKLIIALGDQSKEVRTGASNVLARMGKNAATDEVITKLVIALGDQNEQVKTSACDALGEIGEKAATNEVISKLAIALGDQSEELRESACYVLGKMGEKAATDEVITKLVIALGDRSERVRISACDALGEIGEKAATNEVISKLVIALGDQSERVRTSACRALGYIGEKAVTNEMITKVVITLGDQSEELRESACYVLGKMGEKAATDEVITKLVIALGDRSERVRISACDALGKMGENAATGEVIFRVMSLVLDKDENVRMSAYGAGVALSKKTVTTDVITGFICALLDGNKYVRISQGYEQQGVVEKEGSIELVRELFRYGANKSNNNSTAVVEEVNKILTTACNSRTLSLSILRDYYVGGGSVDFFVGIPLDRFLKISTETKNSDWLPVIIHIFLMRGVAITIYEGKVLLYENKEPFEVSFLSDDLYKQLHDSLVEQRKRLGLDCDSVTEVSQNSLTNSKHTTH